jgi:hypothetical protein
VSAMAYPEPPVLTPEAKRRQRNRNLAIAAGLVLLIVLFYLMTVFKLGGNVLNRGL